MNSKNFLPLFLSALLILGIVAFIYMRPSDNNMIEETTQINIDTSDWNTANNITGYSISYPSSMIPEGEGPAGADETNSSTVAYHDGDESLNYKLTINTITKEYTPYVNRDFDIIANENYEANAEKAEEIIMPLTPTTIDGKPAVAYKFVSNGYTTSQLGSRITTSEEEVTEIAVIETENNGTYFRIIYAAEDPTAEKMVETFKFTN